MVTIERLPTADFDNVANDHELGYYDQSTPQNRLENKYYLPDFIHYSHPLDQTFSPSSER